MIRGSSSIVHLADHVTLFSNVAQRSPILGYNHNVGYRGLVFHVQTEDSGVDNPHLFTHLFHGGVIITTRKLEYDAGAVQEVVKSLMQAQHKAVLKGLRRGEFDDKIDAYLGSHPDLEPRKQPVSQAEPAPPGPAEPKAPVVADAAAGEPGLAAGAPGLPDVSAVSAAFASPARKHGAPPADRSHASRPPGAPPAGQHGNVVVSRAPIVVDSVRPAGPAPAGASPLTPARTVREESQDSIFEQNLITEKSLDEVILAYLSEDSSDD